MKKICPFILNILESFLFILDWALTMTCISLLVLAISKKLYVTAYQDFWNVVFSITLHLCVAAFAVGIIELALLGLCDNHTTPILSQSKIKSKLRVRGKIMSSILLAGALISSIFANIYWGGDIRSFTGDNWWKIAGQWPFILSILTFFFKILEVAIWKKMDRINSK